MPGEATLVFLLQTLKEELRKYTDLKDGVQHELDELQKDLRLLQAFLKDSARKYEKIEMFKEFERQIRELVFEVEDIVEICLAKSAAAKTKNFITRSAQNFSINMAKQVKSLRELKVNPVVQGIQNEYGKNVFAIQEKKKGELTGQSSPILIPTLDQSYNHDKIVDFEGEADVIGYLLESRNVLDVISITGMAGLGKSTFARKIFEHKIIVDEFPVRIWIPVSEMSNSRDLFLNILEHFTHKGFPSRQSDQDIIRTVCACLENKRLLLVMDNISTAEEWEVLQTILPRNNSMAKVLLTTRENEIAVRASMYRDPHRLKKLGPKESLELLKLQVYNNPANFPHELEEIGQIIADKCHGVPLIILVIGGNLKDFFTKTASIAPVIEEWRNVAETVDEILKEDKRKLISASLEWSYNRLAHDLRVCFLYTGLFPENQEIRATTLTKLWIAEGFIQRKDGISVEETADKLLDDLINKNLVTVTKKNLEQVKTCRVHDMIRGFCITKAREENFFRVMKASMEGALEPPVSEVPEFRRVCLHSNPSGFLSGNPNGPRVRSFLCFFEEPVDLDPTHMSTIPDAFNMLRVLSCKSIKFGKFPEVTKLILLKHITLCIDNLSVLPKEISKLLSLQTLIVDTNSHLITVKANISKMVQLRRLKTKAAISMDDNNWKGKASQNLQTMSRLSPKSCTAALSERAPHLKTLGIRGEIADLFDTFSLDKFSCLKNLKIVNDLVYESASANPLLCLPRPDRFPRNLVRLTLSKTYLKWDNHMPILARIKTLKFLKLKDNAFTGYFWELGESSGFPKLQFLLIQNSTLARWVVASPAYFQSLRWLVIKNCQWLQKIPESLGKNLEKLEIECVKKSAADSARKIELNKKQADLPFNLTVGPGCD